MFIEFTKMKLPSKKMYPSPSIMYLFVCLQIPSTSIGWPSNISTTEQT